MCLNVSAKIFFKISLPPSRVHAIQGIARHSEEAVIVSAAEKVQLYNKGLSFFVAERPGNTLVYLRDESAQTVARAATLRYLFVGWLLNVPATG